MLEKRINFNYLVALFALIYIFVSTFGGIIFYQISTIINFFFLATILCLSVMNLLIKKDEKGYSLLEIFWILFALYASFNEYSGLSGIFNDGVLHLITFIMIFVTLKNCNIDFSFFSKTINIIIFVMAVATIIFVIVEPLYDVYLDIFMNPELKMSAKAMYDKKMYAGLLFHYSTNAIFLAFGLIMSSTNFIDKQKNKIFCTIHFITILVAILLSGKRTALIFSLLAIGIVFLIINKLNNNKYILRFIVVLIIMLIATIIIINTNSAIGNTLSRLMLLAEDDSIGGRDILYELAFDMIKEKPIFGHGWGSYKNFANNSIIGAIYGEESNMFAHNCYLQVFAELGIVGFTLFTGLICFSIYKTIRMVLKEKTYTPILMFSVGYQVYFALYCIFGNPLYDYCSNILYFLALSISFSYEYNREKISNIQEA